MRHTGLAVLSMLLALAFGCRSASAWELVQIGQKERSLEISYDLGACERTAVHNAQNRQTVAISVTSELVDGDGVCPAILYRRRITIALAAPLAGRHVEGGQQPLPEAGPRISLRDESRFPVVPRLSGLAPQDAAFLLGGLGLHAVVHVVGGTGGYPRVVSQSPAPGVRDPKSRDVRVDVLR
jgi:hypothetical protein